MGHSAVNGAPLRSTQWLGWRIIHLLGCHRATVVGLGLLIIVASALDIAVPFITRGLIDGIIQAVQRHSPGSLQDALGTLAEAAAAIFAVTAVTRVLRSFYNYRLFLTASACEDKVKNEAFANFLRLDTEYHGQINTGEVIGALDRGGTATFVVLSEIFGQNLLPPILVLIGVLISLLAKNVLIAGIVFLPLPVYVLTIGRLSSRMQKLETKVSKAFETVSKESYDIASNVRLVKKFCQEGPEAGTQLRLMGVAREHQFRGERLWAIIENVQSFISTAGRVGVITLGGYLVLSHRCTVGEYVLFIALQDMVYGPISQLSIILPKLRRNLSRAERLFEILDARPAIQDAPDAEFLPATGQAVEFRNVAFSYNDCEDPTLRDVNFTVPSGSTVALIGPSGSGKSTLMNLLQRLYDPQSGNILIGGKDLRDITQESLREQIAVVPQEVDLFSRSILENIGYESNVKPADVERAARMAQAHDFIERCADGYDTSVGERGLRLSGGERQRLGIARAIVRDPKILILDEATSALDNESERLIQLALEKLIRNRTCFIIAHRLSTVRKADIVVVFAAGTIEAIGTHEELWHSSPTYRKLHQLHVAEMPKRPVPAIAEEEDEEILVPAV